MIDTLVASAPASTADEFVRRTMRETGCPRAVARMALRLIVRRQRPQLGRLHRYLARFTPADRAYWVEQALATERAALASILIGELAEQRSVRRAVSVSDPDLALLARARSAQPDGSPPRGLALLDAALSQMRASSPSAAAAIAAVAVPPSATATPTPAVPAAVTAAVSVPAPAALGAPPLAATPGAPPAAATPGAPPVAAAQGAPPLAAAPAASLPVAAVVGSVAGAEG